MAEYKIVMPKMGESVQEATIIKWMVAKGDSVEEDDVLIEIATDKVDTEIPSPVEGKVKELLFDEGALVKVGDVIMILEIGDDNEEQPVKDEIKETGDTDAERSEEKDEDEGKLKGTNISNSKRFYSPLVISIANKEGIPLSELDKLDGSGNKGRLTKKDILSYIENKEKKMQPDKKEKSPASDNKQLTVTLQPGDEIVEMDRMRKIIASHMVMSKQTSAHVTNFVEADVTALVLWREKVKDAFLKREKQKLTYMPVFIEATAAAIKEFPGVNASVDGDNIILRKNINIGIAVALESGNLIVPVIKNADQKSLIGLTTEMNKLAKQARESKLSPDDIQGGTFTISNFGSFRNLTGTPIINQPQVAILATGNIEKKPAVIETEQGDVIAIRHKMILSLTYDHRVVDGALGGAFLKRLADILESFDTSRSY